MRIEKITDKEGIYLLSLFLMGSTLIIGIGGKAENDAWIAGIAGIILALPVLLIYCRMLSLMPGKDLFEILEFAFGKLVGKVAGLFYVWYAFHLGAAVLRNFGEFINTVAMPETPILVPMLFLGMCCVANARSGVEVMGRISTFLLPIVVIILIVVQLLGVPMMEFDNIYPILGQGIRPVLNGAFSTFSFPFAESVLLLGVFFSLKSSKAPYKVYFLGFLLAGFFIVALTVRNIMILGDLREAMYFPSYLAVSRISIGEFLQRIEVTVSFTFVSASFTKISICMYVASKGVERILKLDNYKYIVIQTGLLMVFLSYIIYDSIMEMNRWAFDIYPYYAFPFQVIIPLILWIITEIKAKKRQGKKIRQAGA